MSSYPGSIYEPREKQNKTGVVYDPNKKTIGFAEDVKKLDDEVVAIEYTLGLNPAGNYENVVSRINDLIFQIIGGVCARKEIDIETAYYIGNFSDSFETDFNRVYFRVPKQCRVVSLWIKIVQTPGTDEVSSFYIVDESHSQILISDSVHNDESVFEVENREIDLIMNTDKMYSLEWDTPNWHTNPMDVQIVFFLRLQQI